MDAEILVIAEHNGVEFDPITQDLLAWAAPIALARNYRIGLIIAGADLGAISEKGKSMSADMLYLLEHPLLEKFNSANYVNAIQEFIGNERPRLVLLAHSYLGIEISGGLTISLDGVMYGNCLSINSDRASIKIQRPMFRGGYVGTLQIDQASPLIVTMQRGTSPMRSASQISPQIHRLSLSDEFVDHRIKVVGETKASFGEDITKAEILIAVGRGIGEETQLTNFRDLAQKLGGAIAASRPLVDLGWIPVDNQVGLSGRTVQPKVYLACGISGSSQHIAGMRNSQLIIAINQDRDAPIFQIAHCGVVGDLTEILPALLDAASSYEVRK